MFKIDEFRKFPKTNGVYKIYFLNNSKVYIGSASGELGFSARWKSHISLLKNNKSKLIKLQLAFNKYFNTDNIIFEVLEECTKEKCLVREQYYIDMYDSYKSGYNSRSLSSNNGGLKMSNNTKELIYNRWKVLRDAKLTEANNLYKIGKSTREICKIMNISRNFLKRIFKENNIVMRSDRGLKKKKIYQYDEHNNFIREWDSLNECSRLLKLNTNGIRCVLNSQCIQYKGYFFSYEYIERNIIDDIKYNFKIKSKNVKYRNIQQIDTDGNFIKLWNNVNEIIDFFKIKTKVGIYKSIKKNIVYRNHNWICK